MAEIGYFLSSEELGPDENMGVDRLDEERFDEDGECRAVNGGRHGR